MVQDPPLEATVPVTPPIVDVPLRIPDDEVPETVRAPFGCARTTAGTAMSVTSRPAMKRCRIFSSYRRSLTSANNVLPTFPGPIKRRRSGPRLREGLSEHSRKFGAPGSGTRDAVPLHGTDIARAGRLGRPATMKFTPAADGEAVAAESNGRRTQRPKGVDEKTFARAVREFTTIVGDRNVS